MPDFGDRFWVYALYDGRTDEFSSIGKSYETKPGFYLIVGPNWKDATPAGITAVVRSSTDLGFAIPRIFKDDTAEDTKAIQPLLNQVVFYPLSQFDGKMKTRDWSKIPNFPAPKTSGKGETKWVVPEIFFDELPEVMKEVPPLPGEEALYKWISSVLDSAAKDPVLKKELAATAVAADKDLIDPFFQWKYNGRSAGNGWNSPVNNAEWAPTISTAPELQSRICMTTSRRRRNTFIATTTVAGSNSMVRTTTRSHSLKDRCRR